MGTIFKEINTSSFIGNIGPKAQRVWKEVDEEIDIIGCQDKPERACALIKPLKLLQADLPGDGDTKQLPIFVNDDVRIELQYCRGAKGANGHRPAGFYETQIQVQNARVTQSSEGDFPLEVGDVLVLPPAVRHENEGDGPATRLIVYSRAPMEIGHSYPVKQSVIPNKQSILLKPATVLDKIDEGAASGGKHFELVENADIMIETTYRSDAQKIYHRGFNQDEIAFQLTGQRATRTSQGDFMLDTADFLLIPPGTSHRNIGDMATVRVILYTRNAVRLADEFIERAKQVAGLGEVSSQ